MNICTLLLFLVYLPAAWCWNLSTEDLRKKCDEPAISWMEQQIATEIKPYQARGLSSEKLLKTIREVTAAQGGDVARLVRVQFSQGKGTWSSEAYAPSGEYLERLENFILALESLDSVVPLPDLDLILSLSNTYDRPLFLSKTSYPVLTISKSQLNTKALLIPGGLFNPQRGEVFSQVARAVEYCPWKNKLEKAFWRGSLKGELYHYYEWDYRSRARLVLASRQNPDLLDAGFLNDTHVQNLNYGTGNWMRANGLVAPYTAPAQQVPYKYLISIDGPATPSSLQWELFAGSAILKSDSPRIEWFYSQLKPYVHYVPFRPDCLDIEEKINWLKQNDEKAFEMAQNASQFAQEHLSDEMVFLYTYKLLTALHKEAL
jgi:hypothetical protein